MTSGKDKFFVCGDKDITALVFKANVPYKIIYEDADQYMVRDEQEEINYISKNHPSIRGPLLSGSGEALGVVLTREEIEGMAARGL